MLATCLSLALQIPSSLDSKVSDMAVSLCPLRRHLLTLVVGIGIVIPCDNDQDMTRTVVFPGYLETYRSLQCQRPIHTTNIRCRSYYEGCGKCTLSGTFKQSNSANPTPRRSITGDRSEALLEQNTG